MFKELQKPLDLSDIDFRVGTVITGKDGRVWATLLAYKDARVDMSRLDAAVGGIWQNEYKRDSKGVLQCGIGVKVADEWIWKWSNGVESRTESAKGEYSDAFKRAGFMWGIGRGLYDMPTIFIELNSLEFYMKDNKAKGTSKLRPNDWTWSVNGAGYLEAKDKKDIKRGSWQLKKGSLNEF